MREISITIEGDLIVKQDTNLRGVVTGSVTVIAPNRLIVHGMIYRDLFAEQGSIVVVHGVVIGKVINNGADLEIAGTIGSLQENQRVRRARIIEGAVIQY